MYINREFDRSMRNVAEKINLAKSTLQGRGKSVRDEKGFSLTADRILTSVGNFMDLNSSKRFAISDAILNGFRQSNRTNFSATDMAAVRDVDVADIAIATTVASHGLTYIAMERAMDSIGQQISFQGLRALNTAAGYSEGESVIDPRTAPRPSLDFSRDSARINTADTTVPDHAADGVNFFPADGNAMPGPVIIGETHIYIDSQEVAFDAGRNQPDAAGWVNMVLNQGGLIKIAQVNLKSGQVKVVWATAVSGSTDSFKINVCIDRVAEKDGAHTLKLKPYIEQAELVATENRVVLQTSVEVQAQMNKVLRKNAQYGINVDFGKRAIDQVVQLYTYFIDTLIVRKLWEGVRNQSVEAVLDLTSYSSSYSNFVATKNDRLGQFTDQLCTRFLNKTGSPVTALIVDENAGLMYQSDKESFVPDPAAMQRRDGLIGTYRGIPVVRNILLDNQGNLFNHYDGHSETDKHAATVIGVFKSPDGQAAPVAMGDYLPPYSTLPAVNANNPGELSQALFSQTACKCVVPSWAIRGEILPYGI